MTGEESYLAVDKGAINWGHVLVLPIEHHRCGLALPPGTHAEMMRFLSALRSCYAAQARAPKALGIAGTGFWAPKLEARTRPAVTAGPLCECSAVAKRTDTSS